MERKNVYLDDCLIGHARAWPEVHALMEAQNILFANKPRGAQGPSGFYLTGTLVERSTEQRRWATIR